MSARLLAVFGVAVVIAVPAPVRCADAEKTKPPTAVVRLKSIDGLLDDFKYVAKHAGFAEEANQIDGFLKAFLGDKESAIDTKRPIGFYGAISDDVINSDGLILLPVGDEQAFVDLLGRFGFGAKKGKDDIYEGESTNIPIPVPIYFRIANKYAYVTGRTKAALEKKNLPDPEKVLAVGGTATAYASFNLDQIPDGLKQVANGFLDLRLAEEQEKKQPGETKAQHALRAETIKGVGQQMQSLINEGGNLVVYFEVDQKNKELAFEANFRGQQRSKLAAQIAQLAQSQTLFAGLPSTNSALKLLLHWSFPENIRQAFEPVIDEGVQNLLRNAQDETQRTQAAKFFKSLEPTFKGGELDAGVSLMGPDSEKQYTIVGGFKLKEGMPVEQAIRDLAQLLPERDRGIIKFNADVAGAVKIHRADVQGLFNPAVRAALGENPFSLAVRPDAFLAARGPDGLNDLKTALNGQPNSGPMVHFEVALASLAPAMIQIAKARGEKDAQELIQKAVQEAFGKGEKGNDIARVTFTGGPTLKARYVVKTEALTFFANIYRTRFDAAK